MIGQDFEYLAPRFLADEGSETFKILVQMAGWESGALAGAADCAHPGNEDSAGAAFLSFVRDGVVSAFKGADPLPTWDTLCEITSDAPDIHLSTMWQEFIDLQGYNWDNESGASEPNDMARSILGDIATALLLSLMRTLDNAAQLDVEHGQDEAASVTHDNGVVEVLDKDAYGFPNDVATCGHCGRSWDDSVVSSMTPVPAARCPFEYEHEDDDEADGTPDADLRHTADKGR
jgi:hypothetical protein